MESAQIIPNDINKVGIAVRNLGPSQIGFSIISQVNKFLAENTNYDVLTFCEYFVQPCIQPKFASFRPEEMWSFDGPIIATNLSTAQAVLKAPTRSKKWLYCWDLEWLRFPNKQWESLKEIYCNPNLNLIARHKEHQNVLYRAWNKPVQLVQDFDMKALVKICG